MTAPVDHRTPAPLRWLAAMALLALGACSTAPPPGPQSVAGLSPVGTVSVTETFVGGFAEGNGDLTYQGQTHPFRLVGTIFGPGGGVSRIQAAGEVYNLNSLGDFPGSYTQGSGPVGLDTSKTGDLWLRNNAGVIMHLTGTSSGVMLSLGRDEILIRMKQ